MGQGEKHQDSLGAVGLAVGEEAQGVRNELQTRIGADLIGARRTFNPIQRRGDVK